MDIADKLQSENRILLVEDESIIAMNIEETLINMGYNNVEIALSATSAVEKLDTNSYDLAILDINLNDQIDGIELAAQIKKKTDGVPIIFLTGNSDDLTVSKAKKIEPNAYLIKPFNERDLKINLDIIFFQQTNQSQNLKKRHQIKLSKDFLNNNPNLIMRIGLDGELLFVNNYISRISGKQSSFYADKTLMNAELDDSFIEIIHNGMQTVREKKRNVSIEHPINTFMGERMMSILFIPEKILEDNLNSVAIIFQDITDQKISTLDLTRKNKKITDSINYSKKLQDALLPDNIRLRQYFEDSHILLKSKDIVGGDFPWLFKKGNYVYIAAVDCTGHGVPGALISIIIHFLLNEVVKTSDDLSTGRILEILHVFLKKTLKQHIPEIKLNDGADIALSRIDLISNEIQYSGAHRPLLIKRENEIIEIKGDRQPIGGVQYSKKKKRRLRFTDNAMLLREGDIFFMFSDGLPDQFGGFEAKQQKYGLQRIKDVLLECSGSAQEISSAVELDYNKWKGSTKQIDDVILISVKV